MDYTDEKKRKKELDTRKHTGASEQRVDALSTSPRPQRSMSTDVRCAPPDPPDGRMAPGSPRSAFAQESWPSLSAAAAADLRIGRGNDARLRGRAVAAPRATRVEEKKRDASLSAAHRSDDAPAGRRQVLDESLNLAFLGNRRIDASSGAAPQTSSAHALKEGGLADCNREIHQRTRWNPTTSWKRSPVSRSMSLNWMIML